MKTINFERGQDPKKSLNIGLEAQINKYKKENRNEDEYFVLQAAMGNKDYPIIKFLLQSGRVDPNDTSNFRCLLLEVINTVCIFYQEIPKIFLENGLDPNKKIDTNPYNKIPHFITPLEYIIKRLYLRPPKEIIKYLYSTVELFLQYGADPNISNGEPLVLAIKLKKPEVIKILLKYGADPNIGRRRAIQRLKKILNSPYLMSEAPVYDEMKEILKDYL